MKNIIEELNELVYFDLSDIDKIMENLKDVDFLYEDFKKKYGFITEEQADEMIKYECNNSSIDRMVCFLGNIELINQDYYYINGYENLENVTQSLLECFKSDLIAELERRNYE